MSRIREEIAVIPRLHELPVPLGLRTFPHPLLSLGVMGVVVVLVDDEDLVGSIDECSPLLGRSPEQPIVKGRAAQCERQQSP